MDFPGSLYFSLMSKKSNVWEISWFCIKLILSLKALSRSALATVYMLLKNKWNFLNKICSIVDWSKSFEKFRCSTLRVYSRTFSEMFFAWTRRVPIYLFNELFDILRAIFGNTNLIRTCLYLTTNKIVSELFKLQWTRRASFFAILPQMVTDLCENYFRTRHSG